MDRTFDQIEQVVSLVRDVLGEDVLGVYLLGSAAVGSLRPASDIDLLAVARRPTTPTERRILIERLLPVSGRGDPTGNSRPVDLTIVAQADVRPWRYPPRLDFQYGDWWRGEFMRGNLAPWESPNPDLALLLAMALQANRPLLGPPPAELIDPIPMTDVRRAMLDSIPSILSYLDGDEANVVLTFVRVWRTLASGAFWSKDAAADWALQTATRGGPRRAGSRPGDLPWRSDRRLGRPAAASPVVRRSGDRGDRARHRLHLVHGLIGSAAWPRLSRDIGDPEGEGLRHPDEGVSPPEPGRQFVAGNHAGLDRDILAASEPHRAAAGCKDVQAPPGCGPVGEADEEPVVLPLHRQRRCIPSPRSPADVEHERRRREPASPPEPHDQRVETSSCDHVEQAMAEDGRRPNETPFFSRARSHEGPRAAESRERPGTANQMVAATNTSQASPAMRARPRRSAGIVSNATPSAAMT